MRDRIEAMFSDLRSRGKGAFMPYVCAGDPDLEFTRDLMFALRDVGADLIEVGLPYSDPLADGPTIQRASQRALAAGTSPAQVIELISEIRGELEIPLVFMTYYNLIHRFGPFDFIDAARKAGVDGLIIPELLPEAEPEFHRRLSASGLADIRLAAPTSSGKRLEIITEGAGGFIYCVSVAGVTGSRSELAGQAKKLVDRLRQYTSLPLCVGFGVSAPEHVGEICSFADGVIVGSALIETIEKGFNRHGDRGRESVLAEVRDFARKLSAPTKPVDQ